jgi:hypothetical protein
MLGRGHTILTSRELTWCEDSVSPALQYDVHGATLANNTRFFFGVRPILP